MSFKKAKRGISSIIITLLMILLTIVLISSLYVTLRPLVERQLKKSDICLELMGKVELSDAETCYNTTSNKVLFFLDIKDTDKVDRIDIVISNNETQKSMFITNTPGAVEGLEEFGKIFYVDLPGKKSGKLYLYNWTQQIPPKIIEIIPSSEGYSCSSADIIPQIPLCG